MSELTENELLEELKRRFELNKQALKEVQELNEQLKNVNRKLEESESLKSHFISNITNEIINPFASILALSRNIMTIKNDNWDKAQNMVSLIYSEAFSIDFQLKNIFVAAKLEAGEVYPEILNVDIKQLVESLIESFQCEYEKKKVQVKFIFDIKTQKDKPFYFKTDAEKLILIIANLLFNAIKFSFENGEILIRVWKKSDNLNISVKDFGAGISIENQKIIFDRFKRLDSGINSLNRGHGLGLSINKALIELFDGKIEIESDLGKGTNFIVSIPEADIDTRGFTSDGNEMFFGDGMDIKGEENTF